MTQIKSATLRSCLVVIGLTACICVASAQEPTFPFGQSNNFALNTNRIGFADTAILTISGLPNETGLPAMASLLSLTPNPFNPRITIAFRVAQDGLVELTIYDLFGRRVNELAAEHFTAGEYSWQWDGRNDEGAIMATGVYLVQLKSDSATDSKKITLVK